MIPQHVRQIATHVLILIAVAVIGFAQPAEARESRKHKRSHVTRHHARKRHPLPVDGNALYADLVIEARTGRILRATNADSLRHPASLTKMMTLYVAFQALESGRLNLDQRLTVSANAASQPPSKLGLKAGRSIKVGEAILGLVTESANDAAVVLAEAMAGSERGFAQHMTKQAHALGMKKTVFRNPSGLPNDEQVTTARDMAALGAALIYHYPQYYAYFSRANFTYGRTTHRNHNRLMSRYQGMDGIKTGYVRASGFNLVASAMQRNVRLVGVVFGGRSTTSRDNQMARILDDGFASAGGGTSKVYETQGQEAEGDSAADIADNNYIALPSKIAAVFPRGARESAPQDAAPKIASATNWGIQVGAYSDSESGRQALAFMARNMTPLVDQADKILQKVSAGDGGAIYRARFMGMDRDKARTACEWFVKRGQSCLVVAPEHVSGITQISPTENLSEEG